MANPWEIDCQFFFPKGGRGCLPNYPLCVSYETGKHDYQHNCTDLALCFWPNYLLRSRVKTIDPDEVIPFSFSDWRAGKDPVFERATALAMKNLQIGLAS